MNAKNKVMMGTLILTANLCSYTSVAQSLEQAIETTITTEPKIAEAFHLFKATQQDVNAAKSGYLPQIDLEAGFGYENTNNFSTRLRGEDGVGLNRGELSISLKQKLFDGFAVMDNVQRTSYEATASQYALYGLAQEQALKVARVYLDVLEAEKVVMLSERNLEKHKKVYDQISDRVKQGLGSSADLSQIEGRMARAQVNIISAEHNLLDAKSNFIEIVGKEPVDLKWPVSDAVMLPSSLDEALRIARKDHPIILSAYSDIQAAGEQYELSKSNYYPKLSLELGASQNNNLDGVEHSIEQISAMLRMRYNLYGGGNDSANKLKAAYQEAQSKDIYALSIRQVTASTKLSWRAVQYLDKQIPFLQKHVDSAKDAERIYEEQFFLGKRSLLDLLDTSNELFQARKTYTSIEYSQLFAQYRVLASTGRLLASLRIEKPKQWSNNDE